MTNPTPAAPSADDLALGGGSPSFSFAKIGDSFEGTVIEKQVVHKTDFVSGEKKFYKDGNPVWQLVITYQTNFRDPQKDNDNGERRVFFPPQMKAELSKAIKAVGGTVIEIGSKHRITFTHETPAQGNPRKEYKVEVTPAADVATGLGTTNTAANTVTSTAPVQQSQTTAQTANPLANASPELLAAMQQMLAQQAQQ